MLSLIVESILARKTPSLLLARQTPAQNAAATSPAGAWVIDPLPSLQRNGLIVVSSLASVSLVSTFCLLCFFTYRFIFWKKYYRRYIGYNQYVVLMYNLVLADFIQGLGFIVSLRWIATDSLHATDFSCFLQGIWLQIGDPMSGMFVLAIALHTFMHVSLGRQLGYRTFVAIIIGMWTVGVTMVIIPIAMYGRYVWMPSVAWCWMTTKHPVLRLWTHYFWIFAAQFFTIFLYAIMFVQLRRRIAESAILGSSHTESLRRLNRVVAYMVIYPIVYTVLSLPLAAGRMASQNGHTPSIPYFCVAGAMMTLSGICDTLLYTLTRKSVVLESESRTMKDKGYSKFSGSGRKRSTQKHPSSMTMDDKGPVSTVCAAHYSTDSTDAIVPRDIELSPLDQVYQHTTITVTHEPAYSGHNN